MLTKSLIHDPMPPFVFLPWAKPFIPVFTFHDVEPQWFESLLIFFKENNFRSLRGNEYYHILKSKKTYSKEKFMVLTFDDGRFSEWFFGYPLLKKYGFSSIHFVITSKVEAGDKRCYFDTASSKNNASAVINWTFHMNWEELQEGEQSGVFDVQSHSVHHEAVFSANDILDFQHPARPGTPLYPDFWSSDRKDPLWGAPIFKMSWRYAVNQEWVPSEELVDQCSHYVQENGGKDFFLKKNWRQLLQRQITDIKKRGAWQSIPNEDKQLRNELCESKAMIEWKLSKKCLHFSPPLHSYNESILKAAYEAGYRMVYNGGHPQKVAYGSDSFLISRTGGHWAPYLPGIGRKSIVSSAFRRLLGLNVKTG